VGAKKVKGGLLLDSRAGILKGGDNGSVIVPRSPEKSRLIEAVGYKNVDLQMPPKGKLPDAVIADLTAWVRMGAPWPAEAGPNTTAMHPEGFDLQQRKRALWAWQPIRAHELPRVHAREWAHSPVDAFILARLEERGIKPAPSANRRTLIRRVSFDLIGLPPTPEEVEVFVHDASPNAFEKVVDRLLASPQFGERWGRHWLDLVRYAESRGHEMDYGLPNAHQYRDYVVRALNADVPYNQFVTEHLAGDLLETPRLDPVEGFNESVLGTGFWFLGEELHSPVDVRQDQADRFDNRIDVMSKAFLGLTVACARCHDHKFDAISSRDYYALFGFLESSSYRLVRFDSLEQNRRIAGQLRELRRKGRPEMQRTLAETVRPGAEQLADYLLAAREGLLAGPEFDGKPPVRPEQFRAAYRRRLESIAESRGLQPARLAAWVAHLISAVENTDDPFHGWAVAARDAGARDPRRLAETLGPTIADLRRRAAAGAECPKGTEVIIDYSRSESSRWIPDGSGFGTGPVHPGDYWLAGDSARPGVHFAERAAARYDRVWDALRVAPGSENDPGALGQTMRAGRTIHTPSFTVKAGKVFYLVRGAGEAYAAVSQHTMIAGPLHAQLVSTFHTGEKFQWVSQDLTPYKDYPAHIEFTAKPGADLEIAMVIQAEGAPDRPRQANHRLLDLLSGEEAATLMTLAAGYQRMLLEAMDRLATGQADPSPHAADLARLANWLDAHLCLVAHESACKVLAETTARHREEEKRLLTRIKPESRVAMAMLDGTGMDERVFVRGSHKALGQPAPRRFLEALAGPEPLTVTYGSGRLELARQMTDPSIDPFLPRVLVNRVWHHLFGRGIVPSVDNFGVLGEPPSHPELLDYLANRFVKDGWSIKRLIRALVLTSTYRMASQSAEDAEAADPQNLLLHRMRVRRLEGEAIRDALLAVSGRLDLRMYGPPIPVFLTPFLEGRGRPAASGPLDGAGRRSLYTAVRRNFLPPLMLAFDTPIPFSTVGRRTVSNVPAQALILLNDPLVHQQAELWARRMLARKGSARERITGMYLTAFSRPPTESELAACLAFLDRQSELHKASADDLPPWKDLAHTLFNVKEFIFLN
jgi:hypothetical protein